MKKILIIMILCFLPSWAYSLTDRETFDLLSQRSKEIKKFPFHVYIAPDHTGFKGTALPISTYSFFESVYEVLRDTKQPGEIFATYHFWQGARWKCFLLRVPGLYAIDAIDLWVFDTEQNKWQKPLRIADWWGDAGYSVDVQAWIEDLNKDGWLDIVRRTLEADIDLENPKHAPSVKIKDTVFIWEKKHFEDATQEYLPRINLKKYKVNEEGKR